MMEEMIDVYDEYCRRCDGKPERRCLEEVRTAIQAARIDGDVGDEFWASLSPLFFTDGNIPSRVFANDEAAENEYWRLAGAANLYGLQPNESRYVKAAAIRTAYTRRVDGSRVLQKRVRSYKQ